MNINSLTERDAIRLAQGGNEDAFALLYQSNMDAVYRYIYKRVGEVYEAENITQTVFTKAWLALGRYKPTSSPFRAWLYRIAHNAVVDHYRGEKETVYWDDLSSVPDRSSSPEESVLSQERSAQVRQAMTHIKPSYQEVLSYRFLNSMDYDETAEALDRQVNNVRVLQHRALAALQKTLTQQAVAWVAIFVALGSLGAGAFTLRSSGSALPGDSLYAVKTKIEDVVLNLYDDEGDIHLYSTYTERRLAELEGLLAADQTSDTSANIQTGAARLTDHLEELSATLDNIRNDNPEQAAELAESVNTMLSEQVIALGEMASGDPESVGTLLQSTIDTAVAVQATINETVPVNETAPINDTEPSDALESEANISDGDTSDDGEPGDNLPSNDESTLPPLVDPDDSTSEPSDVEATTDEPEDADIDSPADEPTPTEAPTEAPTEVPTEETTETVPEAESVDAAQVEVTATPVPIVDEATDAATDQGSAAEENIEETASLEEATSAQETASLSAQSSDGFSAQGTDEERSQDDNESRAQQDDEDADSQKSGESRDSQSNESQSGQSSKNDDERDGERDDARNVDSRGDNGGDNGGDNNGGDDNGGDDNGGDDNGGDDNGGDNNGDNNGGGKNSGSSQRDGDKSRRG